MRLFRRSPQPSQISPAVSWEATDRGIRFREPLTTAARALLSELVQNGQAEVLSEGYCLPHEEVCRLDVESQRLLDLPERYPFDIQIRAAGALHEPEFRYETRFFSPDGKELHPQRHGCLLHLAEDWEYLLGESQWALLEALEQFNRRGEKRDLRTNLLEFAKIKGLAEQTGAMLDRYLHSEQVVAPTAIRVRLRRDGEQIEVLPEIPGTDPDQFEQVFDRYPDAQDVYSLQDAEGKRSRIVVDDEQKHALSEIKRHRRVSRAKLAEIAEHPTDYFDPEVVDLDPGEETPSFSDRVHAVGVYEPRTYPFVSPYKSLWIPGVLVEEAPGERRKLAVRDAQELAELEKRLEDARQTPVVEIEWQGEHYPRLEIERHLPFLRRQIAEPQKPERGTGADPSGPMVLIIKENVEELEYDGHSGANMAQWVKEPFRHLLESPPHLRPGSSLLPHQEEGVAWLQELWRRGHPGGLLADDMGLGKTFQLLSFLEWHHVTWRMHQPERKPYLIAAPIVLLENWAAEYPKFFDPQAMELVTLYGSRIREFRQPVQSRVASRESTDPRPETCQPATHRQQPEGSRAAETRDRRGALDVARLQQADLILTTYETVRDFQLDMGLVSWSVVILDEAQRIKTPGTLVTNALKALKADFRIACTGTPVENSLVDLWCLMDFAAPGHLGSARKFTMEFQRPLKEGGTDVRNLGMRLRARLDVLLKRRLKEQILDGLPPKHIHVEDCQYTMPESQEERYLAALELVEDEEEIERRGQVLQMLHRMRDACDHPALAEATWDQVPAMDLVRGSAKLRATVEAIEQVRDAGEKIILFADRRRTQHLLHHVVQELFGLEEVFIVNGDTPGSAQRANSMKKSRKQAVDTFQQKDGFNTIIMSPLAAGMGLNITGANHVVHYSRWWNPAKEDQASDRVYRIGQERPVHIYLPMSVHPDFQTFDLILHQLLERKRALSQDTLFPTDQAEVTPRELVTALRGQQPADKPIRPITPQQVSQMDPSTFEGLVAALFEKQGYTSALTTATGDKGVDVILLPSASGADAWLVQVKHTCIDRNQGCTAVREIVAARAYYEQQLSRRFRLAVVTNATFTRQAHQLAEVNDVTLHEGKWITGQLRRTPVTAADVNRCELQRV